MFEPLYSLAFSAASSLFSISSCTVVSESLTRCWKEPDGVCYLFYGPWSKWSKKTDGCDILIFSCDDRSKILPFLKNGIPFPWNAARILFLPEKNRAFLYDSLRKNIDMPLASPAAHYCIHPHCALFLNNDAPFLSWFENRRWFFVFGTAHIGFRSSSWSNHRCVYSLSILNKKESWFAQYVVCLFSWRLCTWSCRQWYL